MNALITSLSRKVPMVESIRAALSRVPPGGLVLGADSDPECIGRHFVDHFWQMPGLAQLALDDLRDYCREHTIRWILPTRDGELLQLARWREELKRADIHVMVASPETVRSCIDKLAFSQSLSGMLEVLSVTGSPHSAVSGRWVVKERYGSGSRTVRLDLGPGEAAEAADSLEYPIFQPHVVGEEYSVDLYLGGEGRALGCVVRSRDRVERGESQVTTVVEAPKLEKLCLEVARRLELRFHNVLQAIVDSEGAIHLIECNPRFGGASTLSIAAGMTSFDWFFRESLGERLDKVDFVRGSPGLRLIRHPADRIVQT